MQEPKSKAEVANWCIVNALRLPNELIVSIAAKLMLHLTDEEREQVLRSSSVAGRSDHCSGCEESTGETKLWCCNHCGKRVESF